MSLPAQPVSRNVKGRVVFLGTGTSIGVPVIGCNCSTCTSSNPKNSRSRCSLVVGLPEGNLLVDTTPDMRSQLLREQIGIVHSVLYTHDHVDHVYGVDDLRIFPYYLDSPLPLFCEEDVEARIRKSFDYAFAAVTQAYPRGSVPQLEFHRITTDPFDVLGGHVIPIRLQHGKFRVLGFRFGNFAYCTDTNEIPAESWSLLGNLDVLVLDCLRVRPHPTHFGLQQAIKIAKTIGARQTYFTHMSHDLEHDEICASLPAGMTLAYDGMEIPLN